MLSYPITQNVHDAIQRFPEIGRAINIPYSGRSRLEIVRVLGNTHYEHFEKLLILLNKHLPSSDAIGKRVVQQTDPIQFEQALGELFLLVHLQNVPEAQTWAAVSARPGSKYYDIDLTASGLSACIEVYCPIDFFGFQLVKRLISSIFKYLDIDLGFEIDLQLKTAKDMDGFYAYEIGNEKAVRQWLACLQPEAAKWVKNAYAGHKRQFAGPNDKVRLVATLQEVYDDAENRDIYFSLPTQSTDSKLFFGIGIPKDTAESEWGRKLLDKLKKRQCGELDLDYFRILVVDFSLADTGFPDFICQPKITKRLAQTMELLINKIGPPLPYDAVLPARLSEKSCFGKVIALDCRRTEEIEQLVQATLLDRPCVFPHRDQAPHIREVMAVFTAFE